jgi:hypothetical protein
MKLGVGEGRGGGVEGWIKCVGKKGRGGSLGFIMMSGCMDVENIKRVKKRIMRSTSGK